MNLSYVVMVLAAFAFSKEFVAANEEKIIVASLTIVLILALEFVSSGIREDLDDSINSIYSDMVVYSSQYRDILITFISWCEARNNFLNYFQKAIVAYLVNLNFILKEYHEMSKKFYVALVYSLTLRNIINSNN